MRIGSSYIARAAITESKFEIIQAQTVGVTPAAGQISISIGNGYAGSTYQTGTTGGQWYADETAISGQTGATYVMTPANEGKAITYRRSGGTVISNKINLWTPGSLGSETRGWFDSFGTTYITLGTSNAVATWINRTGLTNATQGTTSKRPIYTVGGLDTGKNAVVANGTTSQLIIANGLAVGDQTVFAVMKTTDAKAPTSSWWDCPGIWGGEVGGFPADAGWGLSGGYPMYGASNTKLVGNRLVNTGSPMILGYTRNTTNGLINFFHNTDNVGTGTSASGDRTALNTSTSLFNMQAIQSTTANTQFLAASLSELVIINKVLGTIEMNRLEGYLAWRWSLLNLLPADHPYKNGPPSV